MKRFFLAVLFVGLFASAAQAQGPLFLDGPTINGVGTWIFLPRVDGGTACLDLSATSNTTFIEATALADSLGWHVQSCEQATSVLDTFEGIKNPNFVIGQIMDAPLVDGGSLYFMLYQCGLLSAANQCDGTPGHQGVASERSGAIFAIVDRINNQFETGTFAPLCEAVPVHRENRLASTLICDEEINVET